jgi:hypothetical protein
MSPDFFDPTPEEQRIVLIEATTLHQAERLIESCEQCNPDGAEIPFDNILDRVYRLRSQRDRLHSEGAGQVSELSPRDLGKDARRAVMKMGRRYIPTRCRSAMN